MFCLPLPLNCHGLDSRLGGLWYQLTDNRLNITSDPLLLPCRIQPHSLPSPRVLFPLGINPQTLLDAPAENIFYKKIEEQLSIKDTVVLTWSSRYMQAFDACAVRLFKNPNMLYKPQCVLDIRTLLYVCSIFGSAGGKVKNSLPATGQSYGYRERAERGDHKQRLRILMYLFSWAIDNNPAIAGYLLRPLNSKISLVNESLSRDRELITLLNDGSIGLLRPLCFERNLLTAIVLNVSTQQLQKITFNICDGCFLCGTGILTPLRQKNMDIDLAGLCQKLYRAKDDDIEKGADYFTTAYYASLSAVEKQVYIELMRGNIGALRERSSSVSAKFYQNVLINLGDISQGRLTNDELNLYYKFCSMMIEKGLQRYADDTQLLFSVVDENNPADLTLLKQIADYPQIL